jgi:rRNA-processing protein FCF1
MSGTKALLDTNVIILLSKQGIDVDSLLASYDEFYVSIITYMVMNLKIQMKKT